MTPDRTAHIEPSKHSTVEVDEFLDHVQHNVDTTEGAGSPAIMPDKDAVEVVKQSPGTERDASAKP